MTGFYWTIVILAWSLAVVLAYAIISSSDDGRHG